MVGWPDKFRPGRFEDVAGQHAATTALAGFVRAGASPSVLLSGPTGAGKTTLALIYAQAVLCASPTPVGSPCATCAACRDFQSGSGAGFVELGPSRQNTASLRSLVEGARGEAWERDQVRVVHLSDADGLVGWRMLRDLLEQPVTPTFIITADQVDAIPREIRDRVQELVLQPPATPAITMALQRVAAAEGLEFEGEALGLLARGAVNFRQAIRDLEQVAHGPGAISSRRVLKLLGSGPTQWIADYADAVGRGDRVGQIEAVEGSGLDPSDVVTGLLNALAFLRLDEADSARGLGRMGLISEARRRRLHAGFARAARDLGLQAPDLWTATASYWSRLPPLHGEAALRVAALGFQDHLRQFVERAAQSGFTAPPTSTGLATEEPLVRAPGPVVRRRGRSANQKPSNSFLTFNQVSDLYEAATFALQAYWAPFNCRITITWPEDAILRVGGVGRRIDRFAQDLQRIVERWGCADAGGVFSRLLLNRRDPSGAMVTTIIAHVPPRHRDALAKWLDRQAGKVAVHADLLPVRPRGVPESVATHWSLLRDLWGGTDPGLQVQNRVTLLDLLQVPPALRLPVGEPFTGRRFSISQNIGEKARKVFVADGLPYCSAMADGAWSWIDTGWERRHFESVGRGWAARVAEMKVQKRRYGSTLQVGATMTRTKYKEKQLDIGYPAEPPWLADLKDELPMADRLAELSPLFPDLSEQ